MQNYESIGLSLLIAAVMLPLVLSIWALFHVIKVRILHVPRNRRLIILAVVVDLVAVLCAVDAWFIEPGMLTVTRISAKSDKSAPQTHSIKIVHISDVHFEREKPLTRKVLAAVTREHPDLIFLTGDIHQVGEYDIAGFSQFMTRLASISPTYFVPGFDDEKAVVAASKGRVHLIGKSPELIDIRGTKIEISRIDLRRENRRIPECENVLSIVLNHTPDLLEDASSAGADWYFAGHTHGGQVRLPFWGAIITNSATGKTYEYGRYKVGKTDAFITRGIGLEPSPAPQARFLCPPEIVVVTVD